MTEPISAPRPATRRPGVALFTAILNFMAASVTGLLFFLSATAFFFSGVFAEFVTTQLSRMSADANASMTYGLNFVLGAMAVLSFLACAYLIFLGVGLLKGSKGAWYGQVALSVIGLVGFPVGTLLNGAILVLLFRRDSRDFFGV